MKGTYFETKINTLKKYEIEYWKLFLKRTQDIT